MNTTTLKTNILRSLLIFLSAIFCSITINAQSNETDIQDIQQQEQVLKENQEQKQQAIIIEHIVQEGDTLSDLTNQYLGDANLWLLNAEINPEISNFDYLKPGSMIRLITGYEVIEPEVEAAQAKIEIIANEVGKSIQRSDWLDAATGDELQPNDGVRTQAASSAVLIFVENTGSESRVQISENSRLFISNEKQESGITRNEIEIEKGEAELQIDTSKVVESDSALNEYEIIIGEVKTTPSVDASGKISTKARLAEGDSSQIMVYSGNSAVESGGVSVDVETGMGTIAKSGEAPSPPEKLLEATELSADNPQTAILGENPVVQWDALDGAAIYKLELCKNATCSQVFRSENGLTDIKRTLSDLPLGISYWRVSGISASGLDGFASKTQAITVSEPLPEPEPEEIPWYIWLIIILYVIYIIKTLIWYIYK